MAQSCPKCGNDLPPELAQHALTPVSGLVQCPSCGESVPLEKPDAGETEAGADFAGTTTEFSGEETLEGVLDELEAKPGGPKAEP
jgi:hypothetical protein